MEYDEIISCGWEHVNSPSAEGPSFIKGLYKCQILANNSVNAINAGITTNPNLTIWVVETGTVLFLGNCNTVDDFNKLTKEFLLIE